MTVRSAVSIDEDELIFSFIATVTVHDWNSCSWFLLIRFSVGFHIHARDLWLLVVYVCCVDGVCMEMLCSA